MEVLFEKVYAMSGDIKKIRKIFKYGKKLHNIGDCGLEVYIVEQYPNRREEEILKHELVGHQ